MLVRQPNKSQQQLLVLRQCLIQQLLVLAKGFTYLTLDTVPVYRMLESLLGDTDEYLDCCLALRAFLFYIYCS